MRRALLIVALLCVAPTNGLADAQRAIPGIPAVPIEPITGILEMFKTHDVVALSEGNHGNEQGHAFRLSLIRDPRFSAAVNDIVVEFGNAHYQAVIDRFVQGEQVAYEELRKVWQDTTQRGSVWDRPIYEEFYRAVRDVNATLPVERRLRVLLGDPPMDWYAPQRSSPPRTDDFPASVIQREVISKKRRALVIYGGMHLIRKRTPFLPAKDPALAPVVATLTQSASKRFDCGSTRSVGCPRVRGRHVDRLRHLDNPGKRCRMAKAIARAHSWNSTRPRIVPHLFPPVVAGDPGPRRHPGNAATRSRSGPADAGGGGRHSVSRTALVYHS